MGSLQKIDKADTVVVVFFICIFPTLSKPLAYITQKA